MKTKGTLTLLFGLFILVAVISIIFYVGKDSEESMNIPRINLSSRKSLSSRNRLPPRGGLSSRDRLPSKGRVSLKGNTPSKRNVSLKGNRQHPVLKYQRQASYDTVPANYGDPIRPLDIGASPSPSDFRSLGSRENEYAYPIGGGPYPGTFVGVPVQQGVMKLTNERTGVPFYSGIAARGYSGPELDSGPEYPYQNQPLISYDFFKPYGPNSPSMQKEVVYADTPFYNKPRESVLVGGGVPFVSSVDSFAPFPEVNTKWEKVGIIQTVDPDNNTIMNAFRKPIAPLQDLFQYSVQDKNGFVVPLKETYLEDGDIIHSVPGRESLGKWKFNDYVRRKWIYV